MLDQQKIDMYIMTNQKYYPEEKIIYLKDKLRTMDDEKFSLISTIELKDPTTLLLVAAHEKSKRFWLKIQKKRTARAL